MLFKPQLTNVLVKSPLIQVIEVVAKKNVMVKPLCLVLLFLPWVIEMVATMLMDLVVLSQPRVIKVIVRTILCFVGLILPRMVEVIVDMFVDVVGSNP